MEKQAAEFLFKTDNGARQRRLGYIAFASRLGEVEFLCNSEEISNLIHLHGSLPVTSRKT
jgi:hypothetical protein